VSPILVVHIGCGTLGLVSGAAALSFRKGSRRHVVAGKVFVASMLTMAAGATYLAILKHEPGNIGGGIFTFYLILTAWLTARRTDGTTTKFDWVALLVPLALGLLTWFSGVEKMRSPGLPKDGVPAGMNSFMGSVMLLAAAGDVRMIVLGRVAGSKRVARHLWRMCFGAVYCHRVFFSGTRKSPVEIAFDSGARATPAAGSVQYDVVLNSHHTPTDYAGFLASPSALHKRIQGLNTTFIRKSGFNAITGRVKPVARSSLSPAGDCRRMTSNSSA
jgi:hypothetical protein